MTQPPGGALSPASRLNGVDRAYAMLTRRTTRGIPLGHSGATENKGSRRAFDIREECMAGLLALSRTIDRMNEFIGRWISWLILVAIMVSAANAVIR